MLNIRSGIAGLRPSDTLNINQISQQLQSEGKTVYKFGFGQSPFPVPEIIQEALRKHAHQKDYLPVQGLEKLREKIAQHTNHLLTHTQLDAKNVFIGPGSKELIYLAQLAIDAPLLLPNPSWVSYAPQAHIIEKDTYWIPTKRNHWKLEADVLKMYIEQNSITKGILVLNYPNNPSGQSFSSSELEALAEVCRQHNLIVISDEIYGLLSFDNEYQSISNYYPEGTLITSGLSKWAGAGGWRLGLMIIPNELSLLYQTMCALASETFSAVSAPIQYAAITAYEEHPFLDNYVSASRSILKEVSTYCHQRMIDAGVKVQPAAGGFYLFPDFSGLKEVSSSVHFCQQLLTDTGVALLPGTSFGRPENELTSRLCFIDFDGEMALKHMYASGKIIQKDFNRLFPKIVDGMDRLTAWLT